VDLVVTSPPHNVDIKHGAHDVGLQAARLNKRPASFTIGPGENDVSKTEAALAFHGSGCNCAQCVLCVFAPELGMGEETAMRLATGFGAGMGRMAGTCGAVTGAFMVLGLFRGMRRAGEAEAKETTYALVREFSRRFRQKHSTLACRDLLGVDVGTEEGMKAARERKLFATLCNDFIRDAVEILEGIVGS
jgi:C_GCAxxG_C_C family probable redox protein